jgi:FdhD protein
VAARPIVRYEHGSPSSAHDLVAVEEPLEIRIAGEPFAVTMRTPGHDHELTAGFLLSEGLIASPRDLGGLIHCGRTGDEGYGNAIDVAAAPGSLLDVEKIAAARRGTLTTSACGICGRRSIDDLLARCTPILDATLFSAARIAALPDALRLGQAAFAETGGLHGAAITDVNGRVLVVREDVGRHNAVDKVVGRLLLDGELPATGRALVISGRSSFEILVKAVAAGIPLVVGVSAPSSLAVDVARRAGVTLVGFARNGSFNAYAGEQRIAP